FGSASAPWNISRHICAHRDAPINSFVQHRQLRRRQDYSAFLRQRPDKSSALQPFRIQAQPRPVPPENFDSVGSLPAEYKQMPAIRIPLQFLHHHGKAIKSSPHTVGHPDLRPCRDRNHRPQASIRTLRQNSLARLPPPSVHQVGDEGSRWRANSTTLIPALKLSSTMRSFSAVVHRRRRSGPASTVPVIIVAIKLAS